MHHIPCFYPPAVRVTIVFNPKSGSTRGPGLARAFAEALTRAEIPVTLCVAQEAERVVLERDDVQVCIGGDGTVLHALPRVMRAGCLLYHVPAGNENLFARHFGMTREPAQLIRALLGLPGAATSLRPKPQIETIDLASATVGDGAPRLFSIMCSIGPDASVVHRLEDDRPAGGGHWAYTVPVLREVLTPRIPRVRVRVDGRVLVDGERGVVVVASLPQYALGINPAHHADPRDGHMDVTFLPASSRTGVLVMAGLCLARAQPDTRGIMLGRGRFVEIEPLDQPAPAQIDGDAFHPLIEPGKVLRLEAVPRAVRVLVPQAR